MQWGTVQSVPWEHPPLIRTPLPIAPPVPLEVTYQFRTHLSTLGRKRLVETPFRIREAARARAAIGPRLPTPPLRYDSQLDLFVGGVRTAYLAVYLKFLYAVLSAGGRLMWIEPKELNVATIQRFINSIRNLRSDSKRRMSPRVQAVT